MQPIILLKRVALCAVVLSCVMVEKSVAAPFQNGSFEEPAMAPGAGQGLTNGSTSIVGWTVVGNSVGWQNGAAFGVDPADGFQHIGFNGGNQAPGGDSIFQTFDTTVGETYTVRFTVGRVGPGSGIVGLAAVVISATGETLASLDVTSPDTPGYGPSRTFTFVATTWSSTLTFHDSSLATFAVDPLLDNVSVRRGTNQSGFIAAVLRSECTSAPPPPPLGETVVGPDYVIRTVALGDPLDYAAAQSVVADAVFQSLMPLYCALSSPTKPCVTSRVQWNLMTYDAGGNPMISGSPISGAGFHYCSDCVAAQPSLVGWWPGNGNAIDVVGNHSGNASASGVTFTDGKVGQGMNFNGTGGQVSFGNQIGNFGTNDFTIEFWIKTTSVRHEAVIEKWPVCGYSSSWQIRMGGPTPWSGPGRLEAATIGDSSGNDMNSISAGKAINDGLFHHVALVRSGTNLVFYIDGVLDVATNVLSGTVSPISNTADLVVGNSVCSGVDGTSPFTGQVDEISIYDSAVSEAVIQSIYSAGSAGKCLPPPPPGRALAHWRFDEESGSTAHDSAGSYNGTLSPSGSQFVADGVAGGAIRLSKASNGFVDMGNVLGLTSGDFSLVAWMKTPPGDTTECSEIISKHYAGVAVGYLMELNACFSSFPHSGKVWLYDSCQPGQELASMTSVNDGNWHQVVIVYEAGGNKFIYVDGGPSEGSKASVAIVPNTGSFVVGGVTVGGSPESRFTGLIDEVQVYNYALAESDVDFLFQNPGEEVPPHQLPGPMRQLTTVVNGGGSITRDPDLSAYTNGTLVTLTAIPDAGSVFGGWTGDASGTINPLTVTMSWNKTITATFHDGTAPVITIWTPTAGTNNDERFQLTGTITDNRGVTSANWEWNGQSMGPLTLVSNQFSVTSLKLRLGENHIRVNATDLDGNPALAEVMVTWAPDRVLSIVSPGPAQEGLLINVPVQLNSSGDVGGMSFVIRYDTNYLTSPDLVWSGVVGSALNQVNYDVPGEVRATFALPATAVPAGLQTVATVEFRARSVPSNLTTYLGLELRDVSSPTGDALASGSYAESGSARLLIRRVIGDNNANDLLDVGDATIILRLLTGLDPVRTWDVSGNDVNVNTSLDSGDVIKVMRVVVGLDTQPAPLSVTGNHRTISKAGKGKAGGVVGRVALNLNKQRAQVGELVTLQIRLESMSEPLAGSSFTVNYPTNALRLLNSASSRAGALVPGTAVAMWNVEPGQNNYVAQNGHVSFGASSANSWPTNRGVLAELTFEVQAGQTARYLNPVTVTGVKVANGYDPVRLGDQTVNYIGRAEPVPPVFGSSISYSAGGVEMSLGGEPGVVYLIEMSEDLVNWTPLTTVTAGASPVTIADANATSHTQRFYRATAQ